jgi:hypothetical protein
MKKKIKLDKKVKPITLKKFGSRGRNPHVNHHPTDMPKRPAQFGEAVISETPVIVKGKHSKNGRKVSRRYKDAESARQHYLKWLRDGKYRDVQLESDKEALVNKANEYDLDPEMIMEIYDRGLADWSNDKPTTPEQWAFARVNSFLEGGRAFEMDEDLLIVEGRRPYQITAKTSNKSLGRLAKRKDALGRQARAMLSDRLGARKNSKLKNKQAAKKKLESALSGSKITPELATKMIATLGLNPKSAAAKALNAVAAKKAEKKKTERIIAKAKEKENLLPADVIDKKSKLRLLAKLRSNLLMLRKLIDVRYLISLPREQRD